MPKVTPKQKNIDFDHVCPVIYALDMIGQKWKIPILWHLADEGTLRYNELKRGIYGITNMMLTKSLQELEQCGLVIRTAHEVIPPHVDYCLSDRGKSLIPLLYAFDGWGKAQIEIDRAAQEQE